jgi:hypothetical protein
MEFAEEVVPREIDFIVVNDGSATRHWRTKCLLRFRLTR